MNKILIVDDDRNNRKLFRFILQNSGYETIEAEDGRQAVKLAKEHLPALIIMDIQLPVIDGISAFKILRDDEATKHIPVIVVTAFAMSGDRERMLEHGFTDYLSKPINTDGLIEAVKRHITKEI